MTYLRFIPYILVLLAAGTAGFLWWKNQSLNQEIGRLEHENRQLAETLKAKENARKNRATVDNAVKRMPRADIIDKLQ